MSEMLDLSKPVWTKRGGIVSRLHFYEDRLICGDENLMGELNTWFWKPDGTFNGDNHSAERYAAMQLTNEPPAKPETPEPDIVNHPPHYTQGGVECIDAIRAALSTEEFRGFLKGQILKYTWREKHKGGQDDIEKAQFYLAKLTGAKT